MNSDKNRSTLAHFYVFSVDCEGSNLYERTCGTLEAAVERVIKLKLTYADALFFKDDIPKDFKYYY